MPYITRSCHAATASGSLPLYPVRHVSAIDVLRPRNMKSQENIKWAAPVMGNWIPYEPANLAKTSMEAQTRKVFVPTNAMQNSALWGSEVTTEADDRTGSHQSSMFSFAPKSQDTSLEDTSFVLDLGFEVEHVDMKEKKKLAIEAQREMANAMIEMLERMLEGAEDALTTGAPQPLQYRDT